VAHNHHFPLEADPELIGDGMSMGVICGLLGALMEGCDWCINRRNSQIADRVDIVITLWRLVTYMTMGMSVPAPLGSDAEATLREALRAMGSKGRQYPVMLWGEMLHQVVNDVRSQRREREDQRGGTSAGVRAV
jgi:hypothetical protein